MKIKHIIRQLEAIKNMVGEDYDIVCLDEDYNIYDFKGIVYHEGLEIWGVKFE